MSGDQLTFSFTFEVQLMRSGDSQLPPNERLCFKS